MAAKAGGTGAAVRLLIDGVTVNRGPLTVWSEPG